MERGKAVVVDASIAVKWFNIEDLSDKADELKSQHLRGEVTLNAPVLMVFEVANALRHNPDFGVQDVKDAIVDLLDLQISLRFPEREWMEDAVQTAFNYAISVYDACYLSLSRFLNVPAFTADDKLIERTRDPTLKHISQL